MRSFFLLIAAAGVAAFIGCAESIPAVGTASGIVVFEYNDVAELPHTRLAVFVDMHSDIRRTQWLRVVSRQQRYEWTGSEPLLFTNGGHQWVGCTNFACPDVQAVPQGLYDVQYTDAAGRTETGTFFVSYPAALLTADVDAVLPVLAGRTNEYVAAFSDTDILVYYGERQTSWEDDTALFAAIPDATRYRTCYVDTAESFVCVLPPVLRTDIAGAE